MICRLCAETPRDLIATTGTLSNLTTVARMQRRVYGMDAGCVRLLRCDFSHQHAGRAVSSARRVDHQDYRVDAGDAASGRDHLRNAGGSLWTARPADGECHFLFGG